MSPPLVGLSSSSSSLEDWCEFRKLVCGVDEARQHYSNATHEVSRLERCLEAVQVALEASERETTTVQASVATA